ncbi:2-(1,2-epoxy-1,2-dihydrophenyl)acetyl-CoA isomerase [Thermocatellispora tengchongensis]|uniref:2-(1,2-epoxy-1,2-dihydrophenyl)acetyl-CoA isomerase n=1 Tax=Thermocatellispora tengchongensis TaxID=1073253 RepID=A0A840PDP0_9ACTN|nr:enoyl-CoA hydratase-related protein [Thermocatellispora tengchongensis]MBB5136053.1 2-(1,2-epoxy-1,2-dihydrophenyl)acetyl-CoA isomerase [Thermocatellispora tengchongensis]
MTENLVSYRFEDGLARIVMLRGDQGNPINGAWNAAMLRALRRAKNDRARVILLSAAGRFFCVGGDLTVLAASERLPDDLDDIADALHRVVSEIQRSDAIVVCSVQGVAAGAGFPLVAAADLVVAARSASFTLGYSKVGLSVDGGTSLLVNTLGLHRVLRLALLNERVTADEAAELGLVAKVAADAELAAVTEELVRTLLAGPARAQAATKALIRQAAEADIEAALRREALALRTQAQSAEASEGTAAFVGKRRPRFGAAVDT